ncbi:MAG: mechanosensitive ion channel [Bacteroidales bacterium]|nr:mechanosensitive ion channel [Bacteroidales bacterium]
MESLGIQFSNSELLVSIFLALLLFVVLRFIEQTIPFLIKSQERKRDFNRYFYVVEMFIWIFFTVLLIQRFSDSNQIYSMGVFILLMIAGFWLLWVYLKNIISGNVFKLNRKFEIGDVIQVNDYQGKIIVMGSHRLELETENGEVVFIPYTHLSDTVIVKLHYGEKVLNHSFTMSTPNEGSLAHIEEKIRYEILNMPWASIKKTPQIKLIHKDADHLVFEIILYALEKKYFFNMEQGLKDKFEKR